MRGKDKPQPPSEAEWNDFIKKVNAFEKKTEDIRINALTIKSAIKPM